MPADIEKLLDQAASQPQRQLDFAALNARRRRRRDTRRALGAGVTLILLALAVVMLPRLASTHVVFEPSDRPAETATTAPLDVDDAEEGAVPAPAREGDVIKTEGRVPARASEFDAP